MKSNLLVRLVNDVNFFFCVKLFELRVELEVLAAPPLLSFDDVGVAIVVGRVRTFLKKVVLLPIVLSAVKRRNSETK